MATEFLEQLIDAKRVSTPLVGVNTQDPLETMDGIVQSFVAKWKEVAVKNPKIPMPIFMKWDIVSGLVGIGKDSVAAVKGMFPNVDTSKPVEPQIAKLTSGPVDMLKVATRIPPGTMWFVLNAHRIIDDLAVAQGLWNLRDAFKEDGRMGILLAPQLKLPMQLAHDVLLLDEPLPDRDARLKIIEAEIGYFNEGQKKASAPVLERPKPEVIDRVVDVTGALSAFAVDQSVAMNLSTAGFNIGGLWKRKCQFIENTPGVKVWNGGERFEMLKGQDNIQQFELGLMNGKEPFRCVVIFDEAEKTAGAGAGDLSGVSQEMHGAMLAEMQDRDYPGMIFLGPGGSGKTVNLKALGNEAPGGKIIVIIVNLANMKSSLVGSSMANLMQFFRIVEAVSDGRPLFAFTANSFDFSPEFQRRCYLGKWFFDLPGKTEREDIWKVYIKKYALNPKQTLPDDHGWTGAEIRACSLMAYQRDKPLIETANFIVPIAVSAREKIDTLRREAHGKFISAGQPGPYQYEELKVGLKGSREIVGESPSRTNPMDN
jgi:hypothetical protein